MYFLQGQRNILARHMEIKNKLSKGIPSTPIGMLGISGHPSTVTTGPRLGRRSAKDSAIWSCACFELWT